MMIACLPPSDFYLDENISTLTYATKASYISNTPNRNEDPRMKIIHELRKKISSLEKELKSANDHIGFLTTLTGGGGNLPQNAIMEATKGLLGEEEVKLSEKVPNSTVKGNSTIGGEEDFLSSGVQKDLPLRKEKSTPQDGFEGEFKSEMEIVPKTAGTSKQTRKRKAKGIKNLGNSKL